MSAVYFGSIYGLANNPASIFPYNVVAPGQRTWLDFRHPEWSANAVKWIYARDVYTGEVLDTEKIGSYLVRKAIGEDLAAYGERQALADFTSHFGVCTDSLAGMLFHVEDDASRPLGRGKSGRGTKAGPLGAPEDPSTTIGHLYRDADGKGTGYKTVWKQLGIELVITHCHWLLVDVANGSPQIKLVEPERVVDWGEDVDGLSWVKVCEVVGQRADWQASPKDVAEQYVVFDRTGWQRYRQVGEGDKISVMTVGDRGTYRYQDAAGKLQLPIFRVNLPLRRNIGFPLAKKNIAIFNKESERDALLRSANFPKLFIPADDDVFKRTELQLKAGAFVIQDDPNVSKSPHFDAPPTTSAQMATEVLVQKREDFYRTFFREYSSVSGRDRVTATEIRQDTASGVGAFLQMLKAALDDAENGALWRLEQAVFPRNPENWFIARVERSDNFQSLSPEEMIERLRKRYFGETTPVPVDRASQIEVMRQILAWDGIEVDEAGLETALDNYLLEQSKDVLPTLPLPPSARAKLVLLLLKGLGIDDPSIEAEATKIATTEQEAKGLLAQPFGPPPSDAPPKAPPASKTQVTPDGQGGYTITKGA